jgi:hypothetical protein
VVLFCKNPSQYLLFTGLTYSSVGEEEGVTNLERRRKKERERERTFFVVQ